jgi:2-succinyl-5-enolpyruvyl-6-hydroxy-3-cyclohexene-1-carboxylate synthase
MIHSDKETAQLTVQAAMTHGIKHVVISPGSRNAPLIIEWNAYPEIEKYKIVDERSAGFFALGLSQYLKEPVALVCTSGTALLNYYPAITEAFYSNIPLAVLSADRPESLIDIGDGQTIRQKNVYQNHIAFSCHLNENNSLENEKVLKEALSILKSKQAPIHINIPFSEPLYEKIENALVTYNPKETNEKESLLDEQPWSESELEHYAHVWNQSKRKMVLVGLHEPDDMLYTQLKHFLKDPSVVVLTETTSNMYHEEFFNHIDRLIFPWSQEEFDRLKPEILITIGGQIVSKKIKALLRKSPPKHHWHIDKFWELNTFHVLTKYFDISPQLFFSQFFFLTEVQESEYFNNFKAIEQKRKISHTEYLKHLPFSDLKVYELIESKIPAHYHIQFSNSAAIRYAQFFKWGKAKAIRCNRGASGIDGSTSTAVGYAVKNNQPTLLITGDLSFFYDSNAFWNSHISKNFKVIIINNGGGGIFRFIPGPTSTNALDFFETPHNLTAKAICQQYELQYFKAQDIRELHTILSEFFSFENQPCVLEIFTPQEKNADALKEYFKALNS